jgi:hypothetical protein
MNYYYLIVLLLLLILAYHYYYSTNSENFITVSHHRHFGYNPYYNPHFYNYNYPMWWYNYIPFYSYFY